jgi:sarcosine oxidase
MAIHTDILIIGGGVMGCAAAYHLAKAGQRVTLIEQFSIGTAQGSSHGPSRIIRLNYEGVDYVQLARAAYAEWHALEQTCGEKLLFYTGGMDIGEPSALTEMHQTLRDANVNFDFIDSREIMRRSPQLRVPEHFVGLFQPEYAILLADKCIAHMARLAIKHGANIYEGEKAHSITPHTHGVTVATDRATYHAAKLIIAAGSWMRPLLRPLGLELPLTVTKETIAYFKPADPAPFMWDRFPLFLQRFPDSTVIGNAFPIIGHEGVKMIFDRHGPVVDPFDTDRSPDTAQFSKIRDYARQMLPNLGENIIEVVTCRYTLTPDEDFIIDKLPKYPHIVIGSPCSGHGFKFGITIGHILADLVMTGNSDLPVQRFRLDRPALHGGVEWKL